MSTLSGILSKGEKGKSKFQSLDINNLYRVSRGESLEQHQQKNTLPRKHGMQTLGRVPSARRPPANLPSLKSEISSSDPAVSLVPSGGSGWATTKDSGTPSTNTTTSTTATDTNTTNSVPAPCVTGTTTSTQHHPLLPGQQVTPQPTDANKSSWSAIMSKSGDAVVGYAGLVGGGRGGRSAPGLSFLAHQSPQFQHEFPSLSGQPSVSAFNQSQTQESSATSNSISVAVQHHSLLQQQPYSHNHSGGAPGNQQQQQNRELNAQYGPGPSLRPQTEGSWIQGGSRTPGGAPPTTGALGSGNTPAVQGPPAITGPAGHAEGLGGGRQNLGQSPNMAMGQAGQSSSPNSQGPLPSGSHQVGPNVHHYRGLIPPFMYRGNFPSGFPPQFSPNVATGGGARPRFNYPPDRFPLPQRAQERERLPEEEIITRPIIKEEDLTRMDDISHDAGWAAHDDIDYNQKLAFSDDEPEPEPPKKEEKKDVKMEEKTDDNHLENKDKLRDNRDNREVVKDNRDQPTLRPWNQSTLPRDLRGSNGPNCFSTQSSLQSVHSLRGAEDDEAWNERRRLKVEVASVVERARQRKEEEEKRFQESTKQAAAKKLLDLEQKLKERKQSKQKEEERGPPPEPKGLISVPPVPIPVPEWEREKEIRERENRERERERSRTSSEGKDDKSARESRDSKDNLRESRDSRDQILSDRQNDRQMDRQSDRQMDRQMDRQSDRQIDRQGDRQSDRQIERQNDRQIDRQSDRQIDRQSDRQIDRQSDRQIDRQSDRQMDRQNDRQIDRQSDRQIDRQSDRQIDRQSDRQVDRQIDRQSDRQIERQSDRQIERQSDRQIDRQSDRQIERQSDRQIERQSDRQIERQSDRQIDRQSDRQIDRQSDRQMDRQSDRQIERQSDRQIERQSDRQIERQSERQIERQSDRQIERQNDRQIDRQGDRQSDRQIDRQSDRQIDRQSERQMDRQGDRQNFLRQPDLTRSERERERDRDQRDMRDREYPVFLRHFQTNIPPRFQKQQAERSGSGFNRISPNAERSSSQSVSFAQQYDSGRWTHSHNNLNSSTKQSHGMPPPRRSRIDSDVSSTLDDDRSSRDHRAQLSREDRYRHPAHRKSGGYYDEYNRNYKDYDWDDRHPREPWERERHFDDKERETNLDSRDGRESRENRPIRQNRDSVESRDQEIKEKKDYDSYSKDTCDDRDRSDGVEWRDDRTQERQTEKRREIPREERAERNERPQRPDSRDSRTSRESKTSSRDDEPHKLRDCGSWVNEISDYEEKKRDLYHESTRERERDRRQPPGPVTKDKLEADDLKSEKRNLTQLKRSSEQEKKDTVKETMNETKKESDIRNRKSERITETSSNRSLERGDSSPKAWADAVSPTFEKEEEKLLEPFKDMNELEGVKQNLEKLTLDKREDAHIIEDTNKEHAKEEKREKNVRNRTNSGSSSSRARECRGGRQWGGSIYTRWSGQESRGRRGGSKSLGRPASARSGSYGHTDSENSADEVSGSTESGKEERRSAKSPKLTQKIDKEERNREVSRREEKRGGEYSQGRNEKRSYDGKPSREGFAPSGEPSRRGRGGFRIRSSGNNSNRMDGYGPPSSKSPFSSERNAEEKQNTAKQSSTAAVSEKETTSNTANTPMESSDDKMMAKQQALTAGITGRRTKSPNSQCQQPSKVDNHQMSSNVTTQKSHKKEESLSKRTRSGSRRSKDARDSRFRGSNSNVSKQTSSDVGNEEWETTSENSEEHMEDHKESRSSRNKHFNGRGNQSSNQNAATGNLHSRRNEQGGNNREQREKSNKSSSGSSRAPGAEKRNLQNSSFSNHRNQSMNQPQNGRSRSQGSSHGGSMSNKSSNNKENTVNRIDEIKLNEPNLVNQAFNEINKKSQSKDKKMVDSASDSQNTFAEDGSNIVEDKLDSDGFQEVRSKKNVKEPRHTQKDENKPAKKDKERERDRSKSKSNNGSQQASQQAQNMPSSLNQSIQQPMNMPQKYDNKNLKGLKLPPRLQKRLVKHPQQQMCMTDSNDLNKMNNSGNSNIKDSPSGPAPPPSVNAWDKPFTSQLRSNSPSAVPADVQLMSGLTSQNDQAHENNEQTNSGNSSQRNSPSGEKAGKNTKDTLVEKNVSDVSSPPVQTLIFENTNYSKTTKTGPSDLAMKSKFSNHVQKQQRVDKRNEMEEEGNQMQQHSQQSLSVAFSNKPNDLMKNKNQEPIQMPLSFNKNEDNADMKLDFTFDSDLSQLTEDKSKSLGMARSMHMSAGQSTISPSTAELNLKIASVKKVWENATPMPTVVEHEDGGNVVSTANSFPQAFENSDVDDSYSPHQQYNQNNMKNEITTSTNVCKLVPPQVKPQQQAAGSNGTQPGSTVPGPSPIGAGQSPMGHPPASLQGPLSPPPFNSTGQPSHINYQEFPQYPGSQAAQYGSMSAIPSPPAMLFNTGSGQLPAQAGGLYGAFQLDQSRSPFTQYPPYAPSLQSSFSQQNVYLQQPPPPPPHAPSAPTPDMYPNNLSQYRITAAAAPPFGQNQQLSNNPNTVLISSSSNSLMSASVKPSSQPIGAIGTKAAPHFQAPSAPQPNQLPYIQYDPNQVLSVSGSYMGNSQLVQRPGPNVQASANSYYSATSADVFPGSQTGFYQPGGATQQTGTHYGLQGFGQHNQSLATGNATPVGLQNFSPGFLSNSGLQIAAAAAQQFRNPTGGLPAPANATSTFLSKHQPQEQPRQLKSPSGNQQDVLASVFSATPQIPSPKSRNCKQQTSQQPQPSPTQHHKYQQYQGVSQSALVSSYNNYVLQQNVRGMGMPPRAGIQPSQQRYPPPIQRPVVPFGQGPTLNNSTQQPNSMPSQQQTQMNRHRPNLHQQQQQRTMKMQQQQYYSSQGNVKIDSNDKTDSHSDKINDGSSGNQTGGNKSNVNQQDSDTKEEVSQQNE